MSNASFDRMELKRVMADVWEHVPERIIKASWAWRDRGKGMRNAYFYVVDPDLPADDQDIYVWFGNAATKTGAEASGWEAYLGEIGVPGYGWESNPQTHFLETTEDALLWASQNVESFDEDYPDWDAPAPTDVDQEWWDVDWLREDKERYVSEYVSIFHHARKQGYLDVWRAIRIPARAKPETWIDWGNVGGYWSALPSGAGHYGGGERFLGSKAIAKMGHVRRLLGEGHKATKVVKVHARVRFEDIDWEHGFYSFWYYPDQVEITVRRGAPLEVIDIDDDRAAAKRIRRKSVQANPVGPAPLGVSLFRSVSPWEMADIWSSGEITGRGGRFSGDYRAASSPVFFGLTLSEVLHHGEDWSRYLETDILFRSLFDLSSHINAYQVAIHRLERRAKGYEWKDPRWARLTVHGPLRSAWREAEGIVTGWHNRVVRLLWSVLGQWQDEAKASGIPTSYVIEVRNNGEGLLYTGDDARMGPGKSEVVLPQGAVGLEDIVRVYLVRDGAVVGDVQAAGIQTMPIPTPVIPDVVYRQIDALRAEGVHRLGEMRWLVRHIREALKGEGLTWTTQKAKPPRIALGAPQQALVKRLQRRKRRPAWKG